ncbi:MAG TPA: biliverdin-producing heme oxygenase [Polyangiaceae bacterium]|jgi:heme oxygenase|nr:biliverdin-producing heme oxygenase [Polyangiaceae bacterium]
MSSAPHGAPTSSGSVETVAPSGTGPRESSLISALRLATRDAHERLETALPLTDPRLGCDEYRVVVEAFHGFYVPLESRLAGVAPTGGAPAHERGKLARLRADLLALGTSEAGIDALPLCPTVPELATPGAALGCRYVVEGATLGGRVIVHALAKHLGLGPTTGAAFFEGYGVESATRWASFRVELDASPWPWTETLAAALATFVDLERWLRARGALR